MTARRDVLRDASTAFAQAGLASAALDAEVLLAHVLGCAREEIVLSPHAPLPKRQHLSFRRAVNRRLRHEPVARITGQQEFWSLSFHLAPATLIPRPDSETVVEEALACARAMGRQGELRVLDLGTGSGCLLLAVLSELPKATGVGVDLSAAALAMAEINADRLGFARRASFVRADWRKPFPPSLGRFHLVLCNPPYIPSGDISDLDVGVSQFEPRAALDGGADGLAHYRALLPQLPRVVAESSAAAVLEVGQGQARAVTALLRSSEARALRVRCDLAGVVRVVSGRFGNRGRR